MRNLSIIILLLFILTSCSDRSSKKITTQLAKDTLLSDSSLFKTNKIFKNPFRDINNFNVKVNSILIDSLLNELTKDTQAKINTRLDVCAGDNCTSLKTISNSTSTLHFFKSDQGEYGFSNDQFILTNDSISLVRNFSVGIESWPTDTKETIWFCTETELYFYEKYVKIKTKKINTKDLYNFDFTLKDVPFEINSLYGTNLYQEKRDELNAMLTMESTN